MDEEREMASLMFILGSWTTIMLVIHLVWCTIRRCWVARVLKMILATIALELLDAARWSLVLAWYLSPGLVADGWELNRSTWLLIASRSIVGRVLSISRDDGGSGTLILGLALVLLLLLASLPFLADFLELFRSALLAMRLHGYVSVQVVQCAVGLFATVPAALVHALDFLVSSAWTLVLLSTRNGDERVNLTRTRSSRGCRGRCLGSTDRISAVHGVLSSGITSPVGSRLCVHGAAGGVLRIAVRHITLLRVWAVLAVVLGVGRAGRSNGWICWLSHTSSVATAVVAGWMILALYVFWERT